MSKDRHLSVFKDIRENKDTYDQREETVPVIKTVLMMFLGFFFGLGMPPLAFILYVMWREDYPVVALAPLSAIVFWVIAILGLFPIFVF